MLQRGVSYILIVYKIVYIRTRVIVSTLTHACPAFPLSSEDESEMVDNGVVAAVGDRTHTPRTVHTHLQA